VDFLNSFAMTCQIGVTAIFMVTWVDFFENVVKKLRYGHSVM